MTDAVLRVLTMNIWEFSPPYEARMALLRAGIERLSPDLMAFQEAGLAGGSHQVAELLNGLGYSIVHQFELGAFTYGRNNGCCIASRWPLRGSTVIPLNLTSRAQRYPYALLLATVAAPPPLGDLLFVCAKPSWELKCEHERELQAAMLAEAVAQRADPAGFPPVIAGDFDTTPDHASVRFLTGRQSLAGRSVHFRDAWAEAGDGSLGHTWSWENGYAREIIREKLHHPGHARRIDYIFLGSPHDYAAPAAFTTCRVELADPIDGVWASDHYAVYAEIAVGAGALG